MSDIHQKGADEVYCSSCGAIIKKEAEICPKCGVRQKAAPFSIAAASNPGPVFYVTAALKKWNKLSGRSRRAEFWWYMLFLEVANIIINIIFINIMDTPNIAYFFGGANVVLSIIACWRRMHDVGKPGGYCLIPIYNIILAVTAGNSGPNKYGPDPKEV